MGGGTEWVEALGGWLAGRLPPPQGAQGWRQSPYLGGLLLLLLLGIPLLLLRGLQGSRVEALSGWRHWVAWTGGGGFQTYYGFPGSVIPCRNPLQDQPLCSIYHIPVQGPAIACLPAQHPYLHGVDTKV